MVELHVVPHPRNGGWVVDGPTRRWYATAHEAERAARGAARACGALRIYVHDRYHRVRSITPSG
jgi:Uncharacterized protein conserved in bacteria (DUF2188)